VENLCGQVCDCASHPQKTEGFERLTQKLSKTKAKLLDERERNRRLSEQLAFDRQMAEERSNGLEERLSFLLKQQELAVQRGPEPVQEEEPEDPLSYTVEVLEHTKDPPRATEGAQTRESFTLDGLSRNEPRPRIEAIRPLRVADDQPSPVRFTVNVTTNTDDSVVPRRTMSVAVGENFPSRKRVRIAERRAARRSAAILAEDLKIVADAVSDAFARRERERQRAQRGRAAAHPRRHRG
jgi:hypothetical protein